MSFKLPKAARDYFKGMSEGGSNTSKLKTLFDRYYLCLMVGFAKRELGPTTDLEEEEFVHDYPQDYVEKAQIFAALLIESEMVRKSIQSADRKSIEKLMTELLEQTPSRLSNKGHERLDQYAAYGMACIRDKIPKTNELDQFLVAYYEFLTDLLSPSDSQESPT